MNIVENVKIGGKVYTVEKTDKLDFGRVNCTAEIDYNELVIRVCPNAPRKMESDFLHEIIHGIFDHLGYTQHDEKHIDELAQSLYMVIVDNPEMFREKSEIKEGE